MVLGGKKVWAGTHVTLGCLDVAVASTTDEAVPDKPVVRFGFGNRCEHRVTIDIAAVRVIAIDTHGREVTLVPLDPRHEIHRGAIRELVDGVERIAYDGISRAEMMHLCIDVGPLEPEAKLAARVLCFETNHLAVGSR
jgi:hypothetical protein